MTNGQTISEVTRRQAEALRDMVQGEEASRRRQILEQAQAEAAGIVAAAHRAAKGRVKAALNQARAQEREAMERAQAQVENEVRQARLALTAALLQEGRERLEPALLERWESPQGRAAWIAGAARTARKRLPPGPWVITHPSGWETGEWEACVAGLGGEGWPTPTFCPDPLLRAGLRLCRDGTCLEATLDGLLARREENDAMFLALLEEKPGEGP